MSRRRRLSILFHRWHRRVGVLASLFLIWMAVSGWLLNHSDALHLTRNTVHATWLAQRYGIKTALPSAVLTTPQHWLVSSGVTMLLDGKPTAAPASEALGMVESQAMLFVASANQLQILSGDGALIDTIPATLLPIAAIARIGTGCNGVVIANADKIFASPDGVEWQPCAGDVLWATVTPLTEQQRQIVEPLLQPGISIERLLLDLHSGRLLGSWGPYFVDSIGLGMVLLALSGVWMFSQQKFSKQQRRQHRLHR